MSVRVNWHGRESARQAIEHGKIREDPFEFTDKDRANMLGTGGSDWESLSSYHLGVDDDKPINSRNRYRYPVGKEGRVYTQALHAIRNAAHQAGHTEVRDAASALLGHFKSEHAPDERAALLAWDERRQRQAWYGRRFGCRPSRRSY